MAAMRRSLSLAADPNALKMVMDTLSEFLTERQVPEETASQLMLALDELLSNAIRHGGAGLHSQILVTMEIAADRVTCDLIDGGTPFDPTAKAIPDVESPLEDRPIGGLGIHLVRNLMDSFEYERVEDRNHVRITKRFSEVR